MRAIFLLMALMAGTLLHAEKLVPVTEGIELKEPFGTGFDGAGNMWIIEMVSGNRLLKVDPSGKVTHVAGQPTPGDSGDGGPALQARFHGPHNLAVLPNGNVLVADTWNGRIRMVDVKAGTVATVKGYDAGGAKAKGSGPYCIALSPDGGTLYIANLHQVLAVDLTKSTTKIVAGNGQKGVPEDGAVAANAPLVDPRAVAADHHGNVYVLERNGNALRVVTPDGKIRTVVNASGKKGASGDGGPALDATMNGPKFICVDNDDSVLIADAENHLIRRYIPSNGTIQRVAGTGTQGAAGLGGDP
jgi:sugar lactone lactonase YvrE